MGGVLMIIACILEFIIGNTMPGVAFGTYGTATSSPFIYSSHADEVGGFYIAQAITYTPLYNVQTAYQPDNPANPGFHAGFGMSTSRY